MATSDADPLAGMSLLYGFKLQIEAVEGGRVIEDNLSNLTPDEDVAIAFENYWLIKKSAAMNFAPPKIYKPKTYNFANRLPRDQKIRDGLKF